MELWHGFGWGVLGGVLAEVLVWYPLRQTQWSMLPQWCRSLFSWACTVFMVLCGGALVVVYLASANPMTPILAVNLGASAPLALSNLATRAPDDRRIG